jgi:hypothetical protein
VRVVPPPPGMTPAARGEGFDVLKWPAVDVALQMTLIDSSLLSSVRSGGGVLPSFVPLCLLFPPPPPYLKNILHLASSG